MNDIEKREIKREIYSELKGIFHKVMERHEDNWCISGNAQTNKLLKVFIDDIEMQLMEHEVLNEKTMPDVPEPKGPIHGDNQ